MSDVNVVSVIVAPAGRAAHAANTAARRVFGKCNRMIEMTGLKVRGARLPGSGTNRADGYASLWEDAEAPASGHVLPPTGDSLQHFECRGYAVR